MMTHLTTDSTLEQLDEFIRRYGAFGDAKSLGNTLASRTEYVEKRKAHNSCRECNADVRPLRIGDTVEITCHTHPNDHTYQLPVEEVYSHRLNREALLRDIACELGYDGITEEVELNPEYAIAPVSEQVQIALLTRVDRQESAINDLLTEAMREGRLNAIFTPLNFTDLDWGSVLSRPLAGVAPLFPLSLLPDARDQIQRQLRSATDAIERQELVLNAAQVDANLARYLNQNPRAIQFELGYTPVFRATESPGSHTLGARFEEVCSAAFETLDFPTKHQELGTNNRGKVAPDITFAIQNDSNLPEDKGGDNILAVVDAKSNAEANIGTEAIVQKHAEYLRQTDVPPFDDGYHISHVFVVLDMKGHAANEIDWYEEIEAAYHGKDVSDITMVVLYADALAQMVDMHLSVKQRNEANLALGDLRDIFRPFFNYRGFKHSVDTDLQNITRLDGRDVNSSGERYKQRYRNSERLLVVTREMVDKHYRRQVNGHNRIGRLFTGFGDIL